MSNYFIRAGILGAVSLAALSFPPAARAAASDPAVEQEHVAAADKLQAKGDAQGAQLELKNALKAAPQDAAVRVRLARMELGMNDPESAQTDLLTAIKDGGDETEIVPLLDRAYFAQGKFEDLLRDMPARDDGPPLVRSAVLVARADAMAALKMYDDARSALTQAEQLAPRSVIPKLAIARLDYARDQPDSALSKVDEVIQAPASAEGKGALADAHLLKGRILISKGDNAGALTEMNAALASDPANAAALIERAQLYIAQNQDAKADADIKAAIAAAPRAVAARYFQALLLVRAKDFTGADTDLTKYAQGFKAFPRGYLLQATVKILLKQYEQAEAAIDLYLAAVPGDLEGEKVQADLLMRMGNFAAAADVLDRAVLEHPNDADALEMLGQAYGPINTYRSREAFDKAAKLRPDNPSVLRGLALDNIAQGKDANGASDLETLLKSAPTNKEAIEKLIQVDFRDRKFDDAGKLIADLIKQNPGDPDAADAAGVLELAQAHLAAAKTAFQDVEKKFPDFLPVKVQLGALYLGDGDEDRARGEYESVLAKDPANVAALANLSAIMAGRGQAAQTLDLWKKANRVNPNDSQIEIGLIRAYMANDDLDGGLSAVREMLIRHPGEASLLEMRAQIEAAQKDYKAAIVSLQRLVEIQPSSSIARRELALMQDAAGENAGAIATIAEARKLDPLSVSLAADEARLLGESDPASGVAATQREAALLPDNPDAQALPGDYLLFLKRPAEALAAYRSAYQAHPSLTLAKRLSDFAVTDGKSTEGEKILSDWVAAHPQDVAGRADLAEFLASEKNFAGARAQYETLAKQLPDDPVILNNLALVYLHDKDSRALALAQHAHEIALDNPQIDDTLGWIMVQQGDAANGAGLLQRAHARSPGDLSAEYHLAVALEGIGRKADAADLLKSAMATGADFDGKADAQNLLARLSKN
jgi:putative PEP-CTERM system TPR-repeat lipoprotein